MGRFSWLLEPPAIEHIEAQRFSRLALVWLFAFVIVVRSLALMQFLLDLDYSEVNAVKLTQFVFVQSSVLCFLIYLTALIWSRPHRLLLGSLLALCAFSLYLQADIVSFLSSLVVIGFTIRLALGLYPSSGVSNVMVPLLKEENSSSALATTFKPEAETSESSGA